MKWRNAKKVAPLNGELCVFYLGNYEYVVGRIYNVSDEKNQEYLIMHEEDGPPLVGFSRVEKIVLYYKSGRIEVSR